MTIYLYHRVPKNLTGHTLYPLNQLKEIHPDLYTDQVAKYAHRTALLKRTIPILDCLWNDVLHFSAIAPATLKNTLQVAGMGDKTFPAYQIDPTVLDPNRTIIYTYQSLNRTPDIFEAECIPFSLDALADCTHIPEGTQTYYKEEFLAGRKPLLFHGIPHILYKGTLDVTDLPIITV